MWEGTKASPGQKLTYAPKSLPLVREKSSKTILAPWGGILRNSVCCSTFRPAKAVNAMMGSNDPKSCLKSVMAFPRAFAHEIRTNQSHLVFTALCIDRVLECLNDTTRHASSRDDTNLIALFHP
jgi:hypothetical protein